LGENLNTWGQTKLNDALERIDEAVGGVAAITISGTATTLTSTNYATDQARKAALVLTGTLSANSTITVPNVEKLYLVVNNATQGAYSLTLKTAAGSGYALRAGPQWVYCDATDVYRATPRLDQLPVAGADVALGGYKVTGLGTPTLSTDAATKAYADAGDTAISSAVAASASAAASSATSASGSASAAATSATASASSATASATSASNSATSATASAGSATAAAGSATAAAASAASIAGGPVTSVNALTGAVVLGVADISGAAPLAGPTFTGTPAAPTAAALTSTTQLATTAFVTAGGNLKADLASPTFTGTPAAPTAAALTSTTQLATTAFVTTAGNLKADLASPALTGVPTAPTAAAGTSTTQLATTAFVAASVGAWTVKTTTYTAVAGDRIAASTSGAAWTLTLPASPSSGNAVEVMDGGGTFSTNNLTIARNSQTIMGLSEDMTVATDNTRFVLVFNGTTWRLA
jgi:hypothetical protein